MVERRKLPWGLLLSLLVLLMVIAYDLSGLAKLEGVTLANWQEQFVLILLHPFHNWWNDLTLTFFGIALIVWIGIVTYLMDYYRNRQMGVEYGSEQWADLKQIQRNLGNKDQTKNTLLSKNVAVDNGKLSNMNLLILGGSGSYKSTSIVIPNLLLASMTNVVLDIKGELLRKTGNYLKEKHIAVKVLNLINPEESDRWNPFVYIRDEVGLVKLITNLQESVKPPDAMKGEPFWDQAVSLYLMSLFSYEWLRQEREKKEHPEQYQAATLPRVLALANLEMQPGSEENSTRLQEKMDDLARRYGPEYPPVRDYRKLKGNMEAQETVSCVILMVNAMLRLCETPAIKRILEADDMEIRSLGTGAENIPGKKTALFLVMPDNDPSFNFLISMFYTTMFDVLIHTADHECGGALPIHVRLWADEFYAGPKPSKTESLMGTIRGRNMSIVPILQSIAQIKALFQQDKWEIFVENCAITIYMGSGPGAKSTHKYISELLGEMTIDVRNDGRTFGAHGNSNIQNQKLGRSLMTPAAVKRMSRKHCLIFIEGQYPIFDEKAIPFQTPEWKQMEQLAGKTGYHHPVNVVFDEEQRTYFTLEPKKQIQFLNREERDAYQEMAKKEEGIYYREIDREAFLYLNFRKHPKPTEQEIEAQFLQARKERAEFVRRTGEMAQSSVPEDVIFFQDLEEKQRLSEVQKYDLSGSILECMERYADQLSQEQKEMIVECLEKGLTEEQIKRLMFRSVDEMKNYQRAYLLQKRKPEEV